MTKARDQIHPAPSTVTEFSEGAHGHRRRGTERRPRTSKVTTVKVNPAVMTYALRLADGDASRLVLHADGTVTVTNGGAR